MANRFTQLFNKVLQFGGAGLEGIGGLFAVFDIISEWQEKQTNIPMKILGSIIKGTYAIAAGVAALVTVGVITIAAPIIGALVAISAAVYSGYDLFKAMMIRRKLKSKIRQNEAKLSKIGLSLQNNVTLAKDLAVQGRAIKQTQSEIQQLDSEIHKAQKANNRKLKELAEVKISSMDDEIHTHLVLQKTASQKVRLQSEIRQSQAQISTLRSKLKPNGAFRQSKLEKEKITLQIVELESTVEAQQKHLDLLMDMSTQLNLGLDKIASLEAEQTTLRELGVRDSSQEQRLLEVGSQLKTWRVLSNHNMYMLNKHSEVAQLKIEREGLEARYAGYPEATRLELIELNEVYLDKRIALCQEAIQTLSTTESELLKRQIEIDKLQHKRNIIEDKFTKSDELRSVLVKSLMLEKKAKISKLKKQNKVLEHHQVYIATMIDSSQSRVLSSGIGNESQSVLKSAVLQSMDQEQLELMNSQVSQSLAVNTVLREDLSEYSKKDKQMLREKHQSTLVDKHELVMNKVDIIANRKNLMFGLIGAGLAVAAFIPGLNVAVLGALGIAAIVVGAVWTASAIYDFVKKRRTRTKLIKAYEPTLNEEMRTFDKALDGITLEIKHDRELNASLKERNWLDLSEGQWNDYLKRASVGNNVQSIQDVIQKSKPVTVVDYMKLAVYSATDNDILFGEQSAGNLQMLFSQRGLPKPSIAELNPLGISCITKLSNGGMLTPPMKTENFDEINELFDSAENELTQNKSWKAFWDETRHGFFDSHRQEIESHLKQEKALGNKSNEHEIMEAFVSSKIEAAQQKILYSYRYKLISYVESERRFSPRQDMLLAISKGRMNGQAFETTMQKIQTGVDNSAALSADNYLTQVKLLGDTSIDTAYEQELKRLKAHKYFEYDSREISTKMKALDLAHLAVVNFQKQIKNCSTEVQEQLLLAPNKSDRVVTLLAKRLIALKNSHFFKHNPDVGLALIQQYFNSESGLSALYQNVAKMRSESIINELKESEFSPAAFDVHQALKDIPFPRAKRDVMEKLAQTVNSIAFSRQHGSEAQRNMFVKVQAAYLDSIETDLRDNPNFHDQIVEQMQKSKCLKAHSDPVIERRKDSLMTKDKFAHPTATSTVPVGTQYQIEDSFLKKCQTVLIDFESEVDVKPSQHPSKPTHHNNLIEHIKSIEVLSQADKLKKLSDLYENEESIMQEATGVPTQFDEEAQRLNIIVRAYFECSEARILEHFKLDDFPDELPMATVNEMYHMLNSDKLALMDVAGNSDQIHLVSRELVASKISRIHPVIETSKERFLSSSAKV